MTAHCPLALAARFAEYDRNRQVGTRRLDLQPRWGYPLSTH